MTDILSSENDSLTSEISSDDGNESGTDEDPVIILPAPKRRISTTFAKINNNFASTCTKHMEQHVHPTSGINQSHISELSVQPTFNTVNADNTSPFQPTFNTVNADNTYTFFNLQCSRTIQMNMINCIGQTI